LVGESKEHRVVVGVDGSRASLDAMRWAADQAERTGARLEIVAAWDWPTSFGWSLPVPDNYNPAADCDRLLAECKSEAEGKHPGLPVSTTAAKGHPAPELVRLSKGADLLVVGSRGHGQFAGMLIGSVSEHCAAHAHCPVLVYRCDGATHPAPQGQA
jgi:nucleotide-binding universal stress UspA family protein